MELDNNLLKEFAKITNDSQTESTSTYLKGTIVKTGGGKYVQIDGSSTVTPISEIVDVEEGDRVLVSIENHKATIVGNISFPPSARKEQEALEQSEEAKETATVAQSKAKDASDKADTAISQSSVASASAAEAKNQAAEAIIKANTANENINETKELATKASADASEAKNQAAASQAASANAQAEVTRLNNEVNEAKDDINGALKDLEEQAGDIEAIKTNYATKVEVGNTKAALETTITEKVGELSTEISKNYSTKTENVELEGRLQSQITQNSEGLKSQVSKVEKLESDTTKAQEDVADALSKANAAQTAATEAQTKANAAQEAANTATANATAAQTKADEAKATAATAQEAANAADQAVQSAQSDLNEAKKNLANVTSRVGATEADIAEAQGKVNKAQQDVNEALADAAEANAAATKAKEAADKAQADATTAKGAADTAQQKATNAQTAATNAQTAAEKAQADVAALTKRVTAAETTISQNSQNITLNATKTEEIGNKVNNLKVGGRNVIKNSGRFTGLDPWIKNGGTTLEVVNYENKECLHAVGSIRQNASYMLKFDTQYVYHAYIKFTDTGTISVDRPLHYWEWAYDTITVDRPTDYVSVFKTCYEWYVDTPGNKNILANTWHHFVLRFRTKTQAETGKQYALFKPFLFGGVVASNKEYWMQWMKLEEGTMPTDWTPAPEDAENSIANVQSNLDDKINNIQIGGRNIFLNSSFTKNTEKWTGWPTIVEFDGKKCAKYHLTSLATTVATYQSVVGKLEPNTEYTMSGWVRTENIVKGTTNFAIMFYHSGYYNKNGTSTYYGYGKKDFTINTGEGTWEHLVWTFKTDNGTYLNTTTRSEFYVYTRDYTGDVYFYNLKLEKGNKATDWTPAPEDVDANIANVQVGGRNYILDSNKFTAAGSAATGITPSIENGVMKVVVSDNNVGNYHSWSKSNTIEANFQHDEEFTFSIEIKAESGATGVPYIYFKSGMGYYPMEGTVTTEYSKLYYTGKWNKTSGSINFHFGWSHAKGTFYIRKMKFEKGNKPTDWTAAPEDMDNNLANNYYTKTQTDAKIKVESDKITSTVSRIDAITTGMSLANAKLLYKDTLFQEGYNSCSIYNNKANGTVSIARQTKSVDNPYTDAEYELVVTTTGEAAPNHGGIYQMMYSRANAKLLRRVVAKIPVGYELRNAENSMGTGYSVKWITPKAGTGKFEEYLYVYNCGATGTFSSGGHMAIAGGSVATPENPIVWYVASCESFDITTVPIDLDTLATTADMLNVTNSLSERINQSSTTIQQLSNMISHLVTDENGQSLMTQTSDGWTFNLASINSNLDAIQKKMGTMESNDADTNTALKKLTDLVNSVANKTAYITLSTDDSGNPCIELGKEDNAFKVRITNTAIDFLEGSSKIAYANNNTFYSGKIITKEIQIGEGPGFVWRTRENGNMGLVYIS